MKANQIKLLSCLAALCATLPLLADSTTPENAAEKFPNKLPFELGDSEFAPGDSITIQEFRSTTDGVQVGGTYYVTGTYTLDSQAEADLAFYATTTNSGSSFIDPLQIVRLKKGTGTFHLIKRMSDVGYLHLTFYSRATGHGIGGVYFGQEPWVLRDKHFSYVASAAAEPVSATGPNRVLFDYLGNPVPPPANMNAAYTKEGLTSAIQTAAQAAGVSLVKLEIDDSEFPFLVGAVFANRSDMDKVTKQIHKTPPYTFTGGMDSDTHCAINVVPDSAFPSESSQQIYHRMMLREAVLYDKMR